MLITARDAGVKRFIYASSSSVYGNVNELPQFEDHIGNQLSPYAVTKYVNELYAQLFTDLFGIETIGLRYFNVYGERQNPNGPYAAVIPLWVNSLIKHEQPIINGGGTYSRDFTYINNVVHANELATLTPTMDILERLNAGGYTPRITRVNSLASFDPLIASIESIYSVQRNGNVPHSQASIEKIKKILHYDPKFDTRKGLELT
ncbi:unnamed protein product, partial [Rotaria sp. Silwood1]